MEAELIPFLLADDKGVGVATALAFRNPSLVKRLGIAEYAILSAGVYEATATPSSSWDTYSNWQLAFFSIPDVAQYFIQGREKEMLAWYFFHGSYSGNSAISEADLVEYAREISKPGFLRSGLMYFEAETTFGKDVAFFNASIQNGKLKQPILALGGETGLASLNVVEAGLGVVGINSTNELVPKAGHWIGKSSFVGSDG